MGCGSSTEGGKPTATKQDDELKMDIEEVGGKSAQELLAVPLAKRMESKYPWEDMEPVPEDTTVVFVLGGPGSGKSTQCKKLVDMKGYTHLVTGDLLRQEVDSGTAIGKWASDLMSAGKLVPNQLSITLLKKSMINASNPMMLIDGFPRSLDQVSVCERGICKAHAVIFFDVSEETAKQRRVASGGSAESFHSVYETFREQSLPVKQHYVNLGKCHVIDASQDPDVVFEQVKVIFEKLEEQRRQEVEALSQAAKARHQAQEDGEEEEEEEEDASYEVETKHVPAEQYNDGSASKEPAAAPADTAALTPEEEEAQALARAAA